MAPRRSFFDKHEYLDISQGNNAVCKKCGAVFKGVVTGNLKRHLLSVHKDVYKGNIPLVAKKSIVKIQMDSASLKLSCVKMLTRDALPFRIMESEGFSEIVNPIAHELGITINPSNIKTHVKRVADQIRSVITDELHCRMFSLKIDSASKHGRSILGINAQFISGDEIQIRTLAMLEMFTRHTAENLKKEILSVLASYNCSIHQIITITTDNGANLVKCVSLLDEVEAENDITDEEVSDEESLERMDLVDEAIDILGDSATSHILRCVRCATHTLQVCNFKKIFKILK